MKLFISSPVDILEGDNAAAALQQTNDSEYYTPETGVLTVPLDRWLQAQQYERDTWMKYNLGAMEDRNTEHARGFGEYAALPFQIGNVLELGCGAFTNTRAIIQRGHAPDLIMLADPLIHQYLTHPNCTYKNNALEGYTCWVCDYPAEYFRYDQLFDTIVLINVLPHCFNAKKVFDTVWQYLKTGGYLVFHEVAQEIPPDELYDVGHPIRLKQTTIDSFLALFEPVYQQGTYFIGRKL